MSRKSLPLAKWNTDSAVVLAARQGFDDGYFRSDEEQRDFANEVERAAYDREFARGRKQRQAADRFSKAKR